jgi:predicted AlkP superfamily pyrophosphatase or phosphodiesterase
MLPEDQYAFDDVGVGEGHLDGETRSTFNHQIAGSGGSLEGFIPTPFGDEFTADFALAAIEGEGLGQGNHPDMLCVSFSSLDACGHTFGPYSHEVQDLVLRLDRQLERLFNRLDSKFGLSNVIILLAADHGVAPIPEFAKLQGMDGGREGSGFVVDLMSRLDQQYGPGKYFLTAGAPNGNLYLNPDTLREKQLSSASVSEFIRDYALSTGLFQACFTRNQLLDGRAPGWLGQCVLNGYNAERSGDVVLVAKPFVQAGNGKTGTNHGSPYGYDTRVPILFFGNPFRPGRFADEFYVTDIAATLATALRIEEPPCSIGKPCVRILTSQ